METDTPETDAKREDVAMTKTALMDMTEHARKLERERDDLRAAIRNLRDVEGGHHTEIACRRLYALFPENVKGVATPACTLKNDPTASTESPRPACSPSSKL